MAEIHSSGELFDYLYHTLKDREKECLTVLHLNAQNQVLGIETPFEGTVDASHVYVRELVESALNKKATAVLLAHNHPTGSLHPSKEDDRFTRDMVRALLPFGIRVLEHLIIGGGFLLLLRRQQVHPARGAGV